MKSVSSVVKNFQKPQPNSAWAKLPLFDRTGWKRVRFGDVVENCNETCEPAEVGLERFVAMEHLEPGSLHVRSWGNVAEGTTFTRRCRPGQVLFGKRRAYQRKVAVAEFEAVVSGDSGQSHRGWMTFIGPSNAPQRQSQALEYCYLNSPT